jgi:hypothetical protein
MAALDRLLTEGESRSRGGIFARLFGGKRSGNPENAIASVQDFWDACVSCYYMKPVTEWMATEQGKKKISDYMNAYLTRKLTLNEMKEQLDDKANELSAKYQDYCFPVPQPSGDTTLAKYLHDCACTELKQRLLGQLLDQLIQVMKNLQKNASDFEPLLIAVKDSLQNSRVDENIRNTYGGYMKELISGNEDVLNRNIHPCKDESELLRQLEDAFRELVDMDPKRQYYASLQADIQFQINRGVAAATNNIIDACFSFKMESGGRLISFSQKSGKLFCIMNNQLTALLNNIDVNHIGEKFIANRSDRIERLYLYAINPESIKYN